MHVVVLSEHTTSLSPLFYWLHQPTIEWEHCLPEMTPRKPPTHIILWRVSTLPSWIRSCNAKVLVNEQALVAVASHLHMELLEGEYEGDFLLAKMRDPYQEQEHRRREKGYLFPLTSLPILAVEERGVAAVRNGRWTCYSFELNGKDVQEFLST